MKQALAEIEHLHSHEQNSFSVIPTRERLDASADYTGKGVGIAFLDSGFYPHPDLTFPEHRIRVYHDVSEPQSDFRSNGVPDPWEWHGTQTSVVAAGNGYLSDGVYSGLASNASVVLVKVGRKGRIRDRDIACGIDWIIEHRDLYRIRVINISLGADEDLSFSESLVDQAAERAVAAGIVVVVAAGNSGCSESPRPIPPANSPSVITVGGYDDQNLLDNDEPDLYCSNFGPTIDGIVKPEIIAPAIWVAAPILPQTTAYFEAAALSELAASPSYKVKRVAGALASKIDLPLAIEGASDDAIRSRVEQLLRERKIVSTHYQHVDGTSFAAPIVASVVAQMIEANEKLTPALIKNILISTAGRLTDKSATRQGYGMLNARLAVEVAAREAHTDPACDFGPPRIEGGRLVFRYHNDDVGSVALASEINGWSNAAHQFTRQRDGLWHLEINLPVPGSYQYKLILDGTHWVSDPSNALSIQDNHGGLNSILQIASPDQSRGNARQLSFAHPQFTSSSGRNVS